MRRRDTRAARVRDLASLAARLFDDELAVVLPTCRGWQVESRTTSATARIASSSSGRPPKCCTSSRTCRARTVPSLHAVAARLTAQEPSGDVLARLALANLAEPPAGPAAGAVEATGIPVTHRLVLVRHEHRCHCGRQFKCTAPSCAGKEIVCICCKLDEIGRRHANRKGSR